MLSDSVDFGLKLPDLSRSELFLTFYALFVLNLSVFTLIWYFSNLVCCSPLCFGFIQGTTLMQMTRSGSTTWTYLATCGATAWVLLARSGAGPEPLCQDPCTTVPGRHHSKTSFFSFFAKKLSWFDFIPALSGLCVRIWCLWFEILWLMLYQNPVIIMW